MDQEFTEHQSPEEQLRARRLSLQRTQPPGAAPGYEIQRFLGAGAYGEVWVGLDRNTGRHVAIKFYLHRGGLDWTLLSGEVEKLVFLSADRYVVQLLGVGWDAEPPYFVMEYIENGSLEELLQQCGTLPVDQAVELFREVAIGLTHAHGKGVLHCDLKPANILLDEDRRPRLADFGQSRLSHEQTPALGTLFYMAPEQADLNAVPDARWDVYALGALLYCLLTGAPPHREAARIGRIEQADSLTARLAQYRAEITRAPAPQGHRAVRGVDGHLAEILDRCLAVRPEARFPNVQAVLDALTARQQARLRRPLVVMGLVGPALLLTIMILVYWHSFGRAVDEAQRMVKEQTYRSNQFAAKFVAKSFEAEIADYFEIIESESRRPDMQPLLRTVFDSELLAALNDPQASDAGLAEIRGRFLADPQRQPLVRYLEDRLQALNQHEAQGGPRLASLFLVDRWGTCVADAYTSQFADRSAGRNFSWRTYFHGGVEDRPRTRPQTPPAQISQTYLSAVYKSSVTERWKIAISTPLRDAPGPERPLAGVMALTIDLGDFAIFRSRDEAPEYFAVLIDHRPGERFGTILQHPLFRRQPPDRDFQVTPQQLARLQSGSDYRYQDPLAGAPGGRAYAGDWIAAWEPVVLPGRGRLPGQRDPTDLLVLVQVRAAAANAPVNRLGQRLAFDGLLALTLVVLAVVALWLLAFRLPPGRIRGWVARSSASGRSATANLPTAYTPPPASED